MRPFNFFLIALLLLSLQTWHSNAQKPLESEGWVMYMKDGARTGFGESFIQAVEVRWERVGNFSQASVLSDGKYAYLTWFTKIAALSLQENTTLWELNISTLKATPLIVGDFVIIATEEGEVYFVERYSGVITNKIFVGHACLEHLLFANNTIFVGGNNWLSAISMDGTIIWQIKFENEVSAPPVYYLNTLYIATQHTLFALQGNRSLWELRLEDAIGSAVAGEGKILLVSGEKAIAVDALSGEIKWEFKAWNNLAGASYYNGLFFLTTHNSSLFAISAQDGTEIWSYECGGECILPPILNRYNVIFASANSLQCLSQNRGELLWSIGLDGTLITGLSMIRSGIFVTEVHGKIYWLSNPLPELSISVVPSKITLYERNQAKIGFCVFAGLTPASNASVWLSVPLGALSNYSGYTDEQGFFWVVYTAPSLKKAENITLEARFSFPGYRETTKNITILLLPTPSVEVRLTVQPERVRSGLVSIKVQVYSDGKGVGNAQVYLYSNNECIAQGYTDANGSFEYIYRVPQGSEGIVLIEARVFGSPSQPFSEKYAKQSLIVERNEEGGINVIYVSIAISISLLSIFAIWNLLWLKRKK